MHDQFTKKKKERENNRDKKMNTKKTSIYH